MSAKRIGKKTFLNFVINQLFQSESEPKAIETTIKIAILRSFEGGTFSVKKVPCTQVSN